MVSDQILPGVDGADFLAQVIRRDPHVSTMLLTGHANYADAMTAVNDGHVFRLLEKPYSPATLRDAIIAGERQRDLMVAEKAIEYFQDLFETGNVSEQVIDHLREFVDQSDDLGPQPLS